MFADMVSSMQQVRAGKLRGLAVTNAKRVSCAPEVPTIAETGIPGYDLASWFALFLPAKAPADIAQKLADLSNAVWTTEEEREFLTNQCLDPYPGSSESLARLIEGDTVKWGRIIKSAHMEPQ